MSVKRRGILLAVGLLTLATVSAAATIQLLYFQLPDPAVADGPGLIRWIVMRDLTQESPETRRTLLVRVQQVLLRPHSETSTDSQSIDDRLEPKYRLQFWKNVNVLLEEWFHQQAELYEAAPAAERTALLDKILDDAEGLSGFKPSTAPSSDKESNSKDPLTAAKEFMDQLNSWIEHAPPNRQPALRRFAAALQARMATRAFQKLMNALGG